MVDNARRMLGVDAARVLAVSARSALGAKLAASGGRGGFLAGLWGAPCNSDSVAGIGSTNGACCCAIPAMQAHPPRGRMLSVLSGLYACRQ